MRRTLIAIMSLSVLGGCTTLRHDGSAQIQTSSEANREDLRGAVTAPLRDVNMLRTKIPAALLQASANPYERPKIVSCPTILAALAPLDAALGPDLDAPQAAVDSMGQRGRDAAWGAVAGMTSDLIPWRSWVRKLSGAERHDRLVRQAIAAGAVRRAYLKGLGESHGCSAPASPAHDLAGRPAISEALKPGYPTR